MRRRVLESGIDCQRHVPFAPEGVISNVLQNDQKFFQFSKISNNLVIRYESSRRNIINDDGVGLTWLVVQKTC